MKPQAKAATTASRMLAVLVASWCSPALFVRVARRTPPSAIPIPASCRADGRSPLARPTITGTAVPRLRIGPTMLITPIASA